MPKLKILPDKICVTCKKPFNRKVRPCGQVQDVNHFLRQEHCSRTCGNTKQILTKHGYSWRARKHLKKACEACGYTKRLQAHHVDQDKTNNVPENIQTLCKHCHDFWHTVARRIGRGIAGRMPSLLGGGELSLISDGLRTSKKTELTALKPSATVKSRSPVRSRGASLEVRE